MYPSSRLTAIPTDSQGNPHVYFDTGNRVRVRGVSNSPVMVVLHSEKVRDTPNGPQRLVGIRCFWFNDKGNYQVDIFSTKDLVKLTAEQVEDQLSHEESSFLSQLLINAAGKLSLAALTALAQREPLAVEQHLQVV